MFAECFPEVDELACAAPTMAAALAAARDAGMVGGHVLIVGERGVGKETVARHVHRHSRRAGGMFLPVDCTALDEATLPGELFGRSIGSVAGATRDSLGLLRAADGGTLYLDEVAALPPATQARLARVLRTGVVERLGDGRAAAVDVRVVAGTTADLNAMVARRAFSAELRDALSAPAVRVPPLRERASDLPDLAKCLLRTWALALGGGVRTLTPAATAALRAYAWPGNLPELAQLLQRAAGQARGRQIDVQHLPARFRPPTSPASGPLVN